MNTITGRNAFLALLEDEGITHLFGNPGTTELPIMHALTQHPDLNYVLGLQESVVIAMADGFARASGGLAACNVHVAPGLGNAIGAIYNSYMSGSPMIVTAGQQEQGHGLTEPLLYAPLVPIAEPVVKWAVEVNRLADLPRIVRRAAKIATTPPTGPVFISLPGDILNSETALDLGRSTRVDTAVRPSAASLDALADRLLAAERPVIVAGHEVQLGDALAEAARFAEALGAPVYQQTVPHGAHFPSRHPAFMGALTRDQGQVRDTLAEYDLMVCLGAPVLQMSVFKDVDPLPPTTAVVQIGLKDWEMGKNYAAEIALRADVKETLNALIPVLEGKRSGGAAAARLAALAERNWSAQSELRRRKAASQAAARPIDPDWLMMCLADRLPADGIVVDEAIVTSRALLNFLPFRDRNSYFGIVSGGIGWGIAAAAGVQLAQPSRPVVAVIGDGSAMYSIQALWTAAHLKLPITYVIANNGGYRILRERLVAFHGSNRFIGMDFQDPPIDFTGLATALGVRAHHITEPDAFDAALTEAIAAPEPVLLDVVVQSDR